MPGQPPDHLVVTVTLLRQAVARSPRPPLLYQLAEALWAVGDEVEAAAVFRRAFDADPDGALFAPEPATDPRRALERSQSLLDHGVTCAPVIATHAIAAASAGEADRARRLVDYDRFCRTRPLATSPSSDEADLDSAVCAEVLRGARFYDDGEGDEQRATRLSWRSDGLLERPLPACRALADLVRVEVQRYIDDLPGDDEHPFVSSRPTTFALDAWAVVARSDGYLQPHLHPRAWLTAVYYARQPDVTRHDDGGGRGGGGAGWLRLGPPPWMGVAPDGGWDERWIEPAQGTLLLFPAYVFHGTTPLGADQERISIAFDVVPTGVTPAGVGPSR